MLLSCLFRFRDRFAALAEGSFHHGLSTDILQVHICNLFLTLLPLFLTRAGIPGFVTIFFGVEDLVEGLVAMAEPILEVHTCQM